MVFNGIKLRVGENEEIMTTQEKNIMGLGHPTH